MRSLEKPLPSGRGVVTQVLAGKKDGNVFSTGTPDRTVDGCRGRIAASTAAEPRSVGRKAKVVPSTRNVSGNLGTGDGREWSRSEIVLQAPR
jgi:hypothetical protein